MPMDLNYLLLFIGLIYLICWLEYDWLMIVGGLSVLVIAMDMISEYPEYGLPYIILGFGLFIKGVSIARAVR